MKRKERKNRSGRRHELKSDGREEMKETMMASEEETKNINVTNRSMSNRLLNAEHVPSTGARPPWDSAALGGCLQHP